MTKLEIETVINLINIGDGKGDGNLFDNFYKSWYIQFFASYTNETSTSSPRAGG